MQRKRSLLARNSFNYMTEVEVHWPMILLPVANGEYSAYIACVDYRLFFIVRTEKGTRKRFIISSEYYQLPIFSICFLVAGVNGISENEVSVILCEP